MKKDDFKVATCIGTMHGRVYQGDVVHARREGGEGVVGEVLLHVRVEGRGEYTVLSPWQEAPRARVAKPAPVAAESHTRRFRVCDEPALFESRAVELPLLHSRDRNSGIVVVSWPATLR